MSPTLTTFLFESANFLALAAVLGWLFFRPVREALDRRRAEQQQMADEAAGKLAEAERMRAESERRFAALERELDDRREQSKAAAEREAEQILKDAREWARRETDAAKRRLAHMERSQRDRLARIIAETVGASIDRMLRQLDQPELDHALAAAACREIRAFDGDSLAPVRVESARPLAAADRDALLAAVGSAGESAEFHLIDDIGVGLRVSTNRGLVDVSSAGLASFAQHRLAADLADDDGPTEDEPNV